jgi:hypothetical protein
MSNDTRVAVQLRYDRHPAPNQITLAALLRNIEQGTELLNRRGYRGQIGSARNDSATTSFNRFKTRRQRSVQRFLLR